MEGLKENNTEYPGISNVIRIALSVMTVAELVLVGLSYHYQFEIYEEYSYNH